MKNAKSIAYLTLFGFALSLMGAGRVSFASQAFPLGDTLRVDTTLSNAQRRDTAFSDTLREVTVLGDSLRLAPVRDAISQSLGKNAGKHVKTLGELLNELAPNAMDYVLHPFGFAERKKNRKRKKTAKILHELDRVTAPSAYSLALDSILRAQEQK